MPTPTFLYFPFAVSLSNRAVLSGVLRQAQDERLDFTASFDRLRTNSLNE